MADRVDHNTLVERIERLLTRTFLKTEESHDCLEEAFVIVDLWHKYPAGKRTIFIEDYLISRFSRPAGRQGGRSSRVVCKRSIPKIVGIMRAA